MNYSEIPKDERKRLEAEVYSRSGRLRVILFAAVFLPLIFSQLLAGYFVTREEPLLERLVVRISIALVLCALIWIPFGRRTLKREVERMKNA